MKDAVNFPVKFKSIDIKLERGEFLRSKINWNKIENNNIMNYLIIMWCSRYKVKKDVEISF